MNTFFLKRCALTLVLAVSIAAVPCSFAENRDAQWGEVKDIHFGEVLYEFYKQNYFSSITQLMSAQKNERLKSHTLHGELLLGGLMVSYGMHDNASKIFDKMATRDVPKSIRNRIWFYTGKIRYQRGYIEEASKAFEQIKGRLPDELEDEKYILQANILMERGLPVEAVSVLHRMPGKTTWSSYGRYNLGVALIKWGKRSRGIRLLAEVGEMKAKDEEMRALKDKANLAIGYIYLQSQSASKAMTYLEKVRLDGPVSNKALLGMGWAYSALEQYDRALVYWNELQNRNIIDSAVQESLLAVPFALGKAQVYRKASKSYQRAAVIFETEINRLGFAIKAIQDGKLIQQLLQLDPRKEVGWFWSLRSLPDAPESRYLVNLLASHEFQEALKNYRDTRFLRQNIQRWKSDLVIFDNIIAARKESFHKRLPGINRRYDSLNANILQQRRQVIANEIRRIEQSENTQALATGTEAKQLQELARLEKTQIKLKRKYGAGQVAEAENKIRLIKGALIWQIDSDYSVRLWELKKSLIEVDDALKQTEKDKRVLSRIQTSVPMKFKSYGSRVQQVRSKLDDMSRKASELEMALANRIQAFAVAGLENQRDRLGTYLTQARFGSTQLIDKAVHPK